MKKLLYFLTILILASCKSVSNSDESSMNGLNEIQTISIGILTGDEEEGIEKSNIVLTNQEDWSILISKIDKVNPISSKFKNTPVDFSEEIVLAVFDKIRNSGGYAIQIINLNSNKKETTVKYQIKQPKPTDLVTSIMTQPYHIVKIKKRKGAFTFQEND